MSVQRRLKYYQRILAAYLLRRKSQLTFWHGEPRLNSRFDPDQLGEYYMPFEAKANYGGSYDKDGIPLLDYHGSVGLQYNPIAIAQYGLGNFNLYSRSADPERRAKYIQATEWLVENLETNSAGLWVWNHHFDWEYRTPLKAPWYSALSQGQGVSLLVRAHRDTRQDAYLEAAERAFETFTRTIGEGGVSFIDDEGYVWFEEAIVIPPTHILNGFLWALWGVYDYSLYTGATEAKELFDEAIRTLVDHLRLYDIGFWTLYEQSGTRMKMLASPFYHSLHIVQLQVMYKLTSEPLFAQVADRWEAYQRSLLRRSLAVACKAVFKVLYY